jgi:ribosomal-protein-alanine N-acetyltransferase
VLHTQEFFLEVRESNEAAIGLYARQGFVKEGVRKNFYEKPVENAVIMWKR